MSTVTTSSKTLPVTQTPFRGAKTATFIDRVGMASGIAFVALFMYYGSVTPGAPDEFTSATLAAFYKQNVVSHLVGTPIAAFSFLLFFVFAATLYNLTRQQEKSDSWLPVVMLGSGIMTTVVFIIGQASLAATALMASRDVDPDLVRGLDEISHITTHFFTAPLSFFIISTSFCILLYRIMPRWIALPNLVSGLILLLTSGSFNHKEFLHKLGVLALLLFLITTLIMSFTLLWRSRKTII